ncbi:MULTISPECIES: hypothetical protein [Brevibacillus]|uniref:hypothetical protein n=1 Tax=Brevibacillus TaxID=55080 RepID=UPI00387824C4
MANPQKQRFVHYYMYFRRYLSAKQSYDLAIQKVPGLTLSVDYLEQVRRSKKGNLKSKRKKQREKILSEVREQKRSFWHQMWSKCGQRLFSS